MQYDYLYQQKYGENRAQEEGYWNMPRWASKKKETTKERTSDTK